MKKKWRAMEWFLEQFEQTFRLVSSHIKLLVKLSIKT